MTRTTFYIMIGMSALLGVIKFAESRLYDSCQADLVEQSTIEVRLASARKLNVFNAELLKRLVIDSHSDPALLDLLKRHNIKVIISSDRQNESSYPNPPITSGKSLATPESPTKP